MPLSSGCGCGGEYQKQRRMNAHMRFFETFDVNGRINITFSHWCTISAGKVDAEWIGCVQEMAVSHTQTHVLCAHLYVFSCQAVSVKGFTFGSHAVRTGWITWLRAEMYFLLFRS